MASIIFRSIFLKFLLWYFLKTPAKILGATKNYLVFNLRFFSVGTLLKTLFSPWHKYLWSYKGGFDIWKYFEVFVSNIFSRLMGAIVRIALIIIGLFCEVLIFFLGFLFLMVWMALPFLVALGLIFGIKQIIF